MKNAQAMDWSLNAQSEDLERRLEVLLEDEQLRKDDRRLARVYITFCRLIADRLSPDLLAFLELAERYATTGIFPQDLEGVSAFIGKMAASERAADFQRGVKMDTQFILSLLEACTMKRFSIYPEMCAEPISWMTAAGVSIKKLEDAVLKEYPEIKRAAHRAE